MTADPSTTEHLQQLIAELLGERRLILASNRGPVEFQVTDDGQLRGQRGSGGVVTALSSIGQFTDLTWIAAAMGEGDRRAAQQAGGERIKSPIANQRLSLRFVDIPRSTYHKYYNVFCNPLLWFIQHYMWNSPLTPNVTETVYDAWNNGYVTVNQAFAEAIKREVASRPGGLAPFILLHDYHLYLAPGQIRQAVPDAVLQHFVHIPWPAPNYWKLLPDVMRTAIFQNICANDIIGLQTVLDVRNFMTTIQTFLPEAEVDWNRFAVWHDGHLTRINAYPISIDAGDVERLARAERTLQYEQKLRAKTCEHTIVRVDRLEPSKNIVRGFRAYQILLERHPELHGKVTMLAFLVPSRTSIRQYQRYAQDVHELIDTINTTFGTESWTPVHLYLENNYAQAIAGMKLYDVLLVNAVIDGMNLVSKEGPLVNQRDGVVILSDSAGSHEQLGPHTISVSPADIEGTAQALHQALTMPQAERQRRAAALREVVRREDIAMWLVRQFEDLRTLV